MRRTIRVTWSVEMPVEVPDVLVEAYGADLDSQLRNVSEASPKELQDFVQQVRWAGLRKMNPLKDEAELEFTDNG